jgi:hypothetical protein
MNCPFNCARVKALSSSGPPAFVTAGVRHSWDCGGNSYRRVICIRRCGTNFCGSRRGQGQRCADGSHRITPGKSSTRSSTCSARRAICARATTYVFLVARFANPLPRRSTEVDPRRLFGRRSLKNNRPVDTAFGLAIDGVSPCTWFALNRISGPLERTIEAAPSPKTISPKLGG